MSIYVEYQKKIKRFREIKETLIPNLNRLIDDYREQRRKGGDIFDLKEKIHHCKMDRYALKNEEIDYYYRNHRLLEIYFTNLKKIESNDNAKKNVDHFFNNKKEEKVNENINDCYLKINGNIFMDNDYDQFYCQKCNLNSLIINEDNQYFCTICCKINDFIHITDTMNLSINYGTNTSYVRLNHFRRIILNWNGIATMTIPRNVLQEILIHMKKNRIEKENVTYALMKKIIKKLQFSKFNNQINYFLKNVCKIELLTIDETLSSTLMRLFLELQSVFNLTILSKNRHNFFGYRYTLIKFLCILNKQFLINEKDLISNFVCKNLNQELLFQECIKKINIKMYL